MEQDQVKTGMDQDVINLAKAIRQKESNGDFNAVGDNGTSRGAYQWQPATWKEHSTKTFGKEVEMTPENQQAVAYSVMKGWKDKGLNPAQIAAKWNSGSEIGWEDNVGKKKINGKWISFDTPSYVKEVTEGYQRNKQEMLDKQKSEEKSLGGFVGNVFQSGAKLIGDTAQAIGNVFSPNMEENTIANLGKLGLGAVEKLVPGTQEHEVYANALGNYFKERYKSPEALQETMYKDPVGFLTDVSTFFTGGGALLKTAGKVGEVSALVRAGEVAQALDPLNLISKGVGAATKPLAKTAAQELEVSNLKLTPKEKANLLMKEKNLAQENKLNVPESKFDRSGDIADSEIIKYATERKYEGAPLERYQQNQDFINDSLEPQIDRAVKNSRQSIKKDELFNEMKSIVDEAKNAGESKVALQQIQDEIDFINAKYKGNILSMEELQVLKRGQNEAAFKAGMAKDTVLGKIHADIRSILQNKIVDKMKAGGETIFGTPIDEFNREYSKALVYDRLLRNALGRKEVGTYGRLIAGWVGQKGAEAFGLGPMGELVGAGIGETVASKFLGTEAKSKAGSLLTKYAESGEKVTSPLKTTRKVLTKTARYQESAKND